MIYIFSIILNGEVRLFFGGLAICDDIYFYIYTIYIVIEVKLLIKNLIIQKGAKKLLFANQISFRMYYM